MNQSHNFFDDNFFKNYQKILDIFSTHSHYSTGSITSIDGEIAEGTMAWSLKEHLESTGWKIIKCSEFLAPPPLGDVCDFGERYDNQIDYQQSNKIITTIFGGKHLLKYHTPNYVITDAITKSCSGAEYFCLAPEIHGIYKDFVVNYQNIPPTKLFNCFISRPNFQRQSYFYDLIKRNLIDQGHISYLCKHTFYSKESDYRLYNAYKPHDCDQQTQAIHQSWQSKLPFRNFNTDLQTAVLDSRFSLVLESNTDDSEQLFFTEKTWRAVCLPRPFFLITANTSTSGIDYLRNIGFDVYDDIVDHSYDHVRDTVAKRTAILDQLERLGQLDFTSAMLTDFERRAQHNRDVLCNLANNLGTKYQECLTWINNIAN